MSFKKEYEHKNTERKSKKISTWNYLIVKLLMLL